MGIRRVFLSQRVVCGQGFFPSVLLSRPDCTVTKRQENLVSCNWKVPGLFQMKLVRCENCPHISYQCLIAHL